MATIYIVDDEPHILSVLKTLLETQGHKVIAASEPQAALEKIAANEHVDLLISDVRMRTLNGVDLLEKVKEVRPSLPVILVTAFFTNQARKELLERGAAACIQKPFDMAMLTEAINKAIG